LLNEFILWLQSPHGGSGFLALPAEKTALIIRRKTTVSPAAHHNLLSVEYLWFLNFTEKFKNPSSSLTLSLSFILLFWLFSDLPCWHCAFCSNCFHLISKAGCFSF